MFFLFSLNCASTKESSATTPETPETTEEINSEELESPVDSTSLEEEKRKAKLTEIYIQELTKKYGSEANSLATNYILAQQRFYSGEYENALFFINRAEKVKETADVFALKGSIYLGLGSREAFIENWRKALEMDSSVPIPPSPIIVRFLKETGLVDENLQKNF